MKSPLQQNAPAAMDSAPPVHDPACMNDSQLIAHLLSLTAPRDSCLELAEDSLVRCGSLHGLVITASGGVAHDDHATGPVYDMVRAVQEFLRRQSLARLRQGQALTSPAATVEFLKLHLGHRRREVFMCIFLDTRHHVLTCETLFEGSIDGASVHPRVVAEHALRHNAAAVIVAHNHPSGVAEPSLADQAITRRLKDALSLLEIRLLDHFIVGHEAPVSMASRGLV